VKNGLLIVGTDGLIGSALLHSCRQRGLVVMGTRRTADLHDPSIQRLDLLENLKRFTPPEHCTAAILCAGITSLDACRRDPAGTRHINVFQTLCLSETLVAAGMFVVFLSSNLVFDGTHPLRRADDEVCPTTEYGRQKAEVELGYAAFGNRATIVRLTKVVNPQWPLIRSWLHALRAGKTVEAFDNLVCAPIPLAIVVRGLIDIARHQRPGLWQFSAPSDVAYSEIARHLARRLAVDHHLVRAIACGQHGAEQPPLHTTLDTSRAREELGMEFPQPLRAIEEVLV
jgi:dTDP-4-dehydrorhamnose reductase